MLTVNSLPNNQIGGHSKVLMYFDGEEWTCVWLCECNGQKTRGEPYLDQEGTPQFKTNSVVQGSMTRNKTWKEYTAQVLTLVSLHPLISSKTVHFSMISCQHTIFNCIHPLQNWRQNILAVPVTDWLNVTVTYTRQNDKTYTKLNNKRLYSYYRKLSNV